MRPLRVELEALRRVAREVSAASLRRARAASARRARGERAASGRASRGQLLEGERERRVRAVRAALAVRDRRERAARSSRRTRAARRRDRESTRAERARLCVERATRGGARPGLSAENGGSLRITRSCYVQFSRATASAALSSSVSAEPTESAQPPPLQCPPHVVPPSALRRHRRALRRGGANLLALGTPSHSVLAVRRVAPRHRAQRRTAPPPSRSSQAALSLRSL